MSLNIDRTEETTVQQCTDEVAGISTDNQVISLGYLRSEEIAKLTDTEDAEGMNGDTIRLVDSRTVRIDEDKNRTYTDPNGPVYTVEDAIDHMGFGPFQILVTIFAGMIWVSRPHDSHMITSDCASDIGCHGNDVNVGFVSSGDL